MSTAVPDIPITQSPQKLTLMARLKRALQTDIVQYLLLVTPALLLYVFFSIVPVVSGLGVAVTDMVTLGTSSSYVGMANFTDILFGGGPNTAKFYEALFWTAIYWLGNWVMIFLLGFIPALIMYENIRAKVTAKPG